MITITEAAEKKIANLVAASEKPIKGLRIGARLDPPSRLTTSWHSYPTNR